MQTEKVRSQLTETHILYSDLLKRDVILDFYLPPGHSSGGDMSMLLINDGQDLITMNFENILAELYRDEIISPLFCIGIHCSADRKNEYGTARFLDFKGRGTKALFYHRFIFEELFPFIKNTYSLFSFKEKSFCGFSLGGLNALDIVWNNPKEFTKAGIFSGSLWWRNVSQDDPAFDERNHRIMHSQIRNGEYAPWLKFFFETGTLDEIADRNKNGIIDSIDDTLSLIEELVTKGYDPAADIRYLEIKDGRHDVETWGRAFPEFLKWGWGRISNKNK
ncbi:MAG TPA: alpha/beta hydrolase-fold protein [Chitinophagaceae bacterium]|nr:alpha/beta hydrolase-fold protein [Chitinophagaceae bacterium]